MPDHSQNRIRDFGIRLARISRKCFLVARLTIARPVLFTIAPTISATSCGVFPSAIIISGSPFLNSRPTSNRAIRATLLMASRLVWFFNPSNPKSNLANSPCVAIEKVSDGQFKVQWASHVPPNLGESLPQNLQQKFDAAVSQLRLSKGAIVALS